MKKLINISLAGITAMGLLLSCDKEKDVHQATSNPDGLAFVKVVDVAPSFRQVFYTSDSFNLYLEQTKINGPLISYNSGFPVLSSNTNTYAGVPAGDHIFRLTHTGINGVDPVSILEFPKTLEINQKYSLLITDSILRNSTYDNIWLKDVFTVPDTSSFSLRFVHAVLNDTIGSKVDVFSKRYNSNIFSNVPVKGVVEFTKLPYTLLADTLIVRRSGTSNLLTQYLAASFSRKRVYTLVYKGTTLLPSTNVKGKNLLIYPNY